MLIDEPSGRPRLVWDEQAHAGYLHVQHSWTGRVRTVQLSETVLIDLDENGTLVGVESIGGPVDYGVLYVVLAAGWAEALNEGRRQATGKGPR